MPFLEMVLEYAVASKLQVLLEKMDYLDRFQSSFRLSFESELPFIALVDDLRRYVDRGSVSLLFFLALSTAAFKPH